MSSIIGNIRIFQINNREISPSSIIYNLLVGTKINISGFKFLVVGDSYINGLLTSDNINLSNNGNYKINNVIIPQTIITNNCLDLTNGVLKLDLSNNISQSTINSNDILILQNSNGTTKKITAGDLKTEIDTTYTASGNITISNSNNITLNNTISLTGDINTNTIYKVNGNQIGINDINQLYNELQTIETGLISNANNISTNTSNISNKQDLLTSSSNININNLSSTSLLCRNNITLEVDGSINNLDYLNSILFKNTGSAYTWSITRRYDASNTNSLKSNFSIEGGKKSNPQDLTSYFFIKNGGNIGLENENPTYKLDINGDCNLSSGNVYRINGTQIAMVNISDLPNKITAIEQDISTNTNNIASNTSNIANNVTNINNTNQSITTLSNALQVTITNITNNSANINSNSANINSNTANITSNTSSISTNANNIASNSALITQLSNITDDLHLDQNSGDFNRPIPFVSINNYNSTTLPQHYPMAISRFQPTNGNGSIDYNSTQRFIRVGNIGWNFSFLGAGGGNANVPHMAVGRATSNQHDVRIYNYSTGWGWFFQIDNNYYLKTRLNTTSDSLVLQINNSLKRVHFYITPTGTSDDRIKFNEKPIENALDTIMKLSPETYDRLTDIPDDIVSKFPITNPNPKDLKKESGFIAQEIEHIPELAYLVGETNGLKNLQYQDLISWSIAGIKELNTKNIALEQEVNLLTLRLKTIEDKLGII